VKSIRHSPELLREQAIDWLLHLRSETSTQSERRAFDDWLAQSPRHRQAYEEIQAQWEWMEPFKTMQFSARDKALRYRGKSYRSLFVYSAAATLLLALGITAFSPSGWFGISATYIAEKVTDKPLHWPMVQVSISIQTVKFECILATGSDVSNCYAVKLFLP
jgi:transmembrane sensor